MATVGNLLIKISAVPDKLIKGLQDAEKALSRSGRKMQNIGARMSATITASIGAVGVSAIKTAADFEMLQSGLNTLTGSAEAGAKAFARLKEFSAKTPFQIQDLMRANNTLMGFGMSADQAFDSFKMLGEVVAVSGGDMQRIAVAYGQSIAANKVNAQDINQFINNGVPILKMLAEEMNVTTGQVKDLASEGKVTGEVLRRAFEKATSEGGQFYKGMEKASQTLAGKFSTLKDNINLTLGVIGESISETINLKGILDKLTKTIREVGKGFNNLPDGVKKAIIVVSGLAAAIGPLLLAMGSINIAMGAFSGIAAGFLGGAGLITASVLGMTYAFIKLKAQYDNTIGLQQKTTKEINRASGAYRGEKKNIDSLLSTARNLSLSLEDRQSAYDSLNAEYPEYFSKMDIEEGQVLDLSDSYDKLIGKLKETAKTRAIANKMTDLESQKMDLLSELGEAFPDMSETEVLQAVEKKVAEAMSGGFFDRFKFNVKDLAQKLGLKSANEVAYLEDLADRVVAINQQMAKLENQVGGSTAQELNVDLLNEQLEKAQAKNKSLLENDAISKEAYFQRQLSSAEEYLRGLSELGVKFSGAIVDGMTVDELRKKVQTQSINTRGDGGEESVFSQINKDYKKQSKELDNLRAAGLISEKDYNKQFEELQRNFLESLAKSGLAGTELYKQIADQYVRVRKETIQQIESIDSQFGGVGADMKKFLKGTADTAMKGGKQEGLISDYMLSKLTEYEQKAQSAIQTLGGLFDSINSRQASVIENQYRSQIHAVNQLGLSEEQRIKRISKLEEEKEKKLAKLQERRAKREKAFAILSATIGTALAVISQMRVPGVGIAQAIAANAMGIAQIATIAAAPIPKFADGGIVSGRTLAEVGEYAGASSNPEVIAPLDKLRSMISDLGGGQTFGEFRLRGEDLILAVDRANNNASRFSGRKQF